MPKPSFTIVGLPPPEVVHGPLPAPIVAGYVRVSSKDESRQTLSPEAQEKIIRDYCHRNGLEPVEVFHERGSAATIRKRPVLVRILEMCRAGQVRAVVVQDLTRLFREAREAMNTFHEMEQTHGVQFHSALRPNMDTTTADGEFVRGLDVLLGQRERRVIAERTSRALRATKQVRPEQAASSPAMAAKAREGALLCGTPPFGYRWGPGAKGRRKLVPHPADHPIVQRIYALHGEGLGYRRITRALFKEGLRDRNGKVLNKHRVGEVLRRGWV